MRPILFILTFFLCVSAWAQTNIVKVNFADFGLVSLANRQVTMTPVQTNQSAPWLISREPKKAKTDTNGTCYFTNIIAGMYDLDLASTPPTRFRVGVTNSGTNIQVAASGVGVAVDGNSVVAYTKTQSDARFAAKTNALFYGSEPKLNGTNFSTIFSGTAYTNNSTSAGLITGSGIGTNIPGGLVLDARSFGVTGYVATTFDDVLVQNLPAQDAALAACLLAASNSHQQVTIRLPAGIIRITNVISVNFAGVKISGHGARGYRNVGWGVATPTQPYTMIWQSNTNKDGIHLNATDLGPAELADFEITGGSNPTAGEGGAYYMTAPVYSPAIGTTNSSLYSKVGITIRGKSQIYCGGTKLSGMGVSAFKIGVVVGGNDNIWEHVSFSCNDIGLWHCLDNYSADWNAGEESINVNAYGRLIDANFNGYSGSGTMQLGVPDQTTMLNPTFGRRSGGVGIVANRGHSITVLNSAGIDGPKTYAMLAGSAKLNVQGGNDEANSLAGTNWIWITGSGAVNASSWNVQVNPYTRFAYSPSGNARVALDQIGWNGTNRLVASPNGDSSVSGSVPQVVSAGHQYGSAPVSARSEGNNILASGWYQHKVTSGWSLVDRINQGKDFRPNQPTVIVDNPANCFIANVGSYSSDIATNFVKFLTTDPLTGTNYDMTRPGGGFTNKENYTVDSISARVGFNGNGSGLTNLPAPTLTNNSGLPGVVVGNGIGTNLTSLVKTTHTGDVSITGGLTLVGGSGNLTLDGDLTLTSGDINAGSSAVTANSFIGDGSQLTSITGGNISAGTIGTNQMSAAAHALYIASGTSYVTTLFSSTNVKTWASPVTLTSVVPQGFGSMTIPSNTLSVGDSIYIENTTSWSNCPTSEVIKFRLTINGTSYPSTEFSEAVSRFSSTAHVGVLGGAQPFVITVLGGGQAVVSYCHYYYRFDSTINHDLNGILNQVFTFNTATNNTFDLLTSTSQTSPYSTGYGWKTIMKVIKKP